MAYAIIGGLFVATLLTLLFLPALYVALIPDEEARRWAFDKRRPRSPTRGRRLNRNRRISAGEDIK